MISFEKSSLMRETTQPLIQLVPYLDIEVYEVAVFILKQWDLLRRNGDEFSGFLGDEDV